MANERKPQSKSADPRAEAIIKAYHADRGARSNVDNTFRDIERLVMPSYEGSNTDNFQSPGQDQRPVSSVATSDAILLGSNIYSHSYSNSDRNFSLRASREDDRDAMKEWLQDATNTITEFMQNSNFGQVYGQFTRIWSNFGTAIMGVEFDKDTSELIFSSIPITSNVYITENAQGQIKGFKRLLRLTADDIVAMFGEQALCVESMKAYGDLTKATEKFDYILCVSENPDYDYKRANSEAMRFRSEYVCVKEKRIIKVGGYRSFPYPTSRFIHRHDGSPYGIGACEIALPTIRGLNTNEAQLEDAMQMSARPVTVVKDDEQVEIDEIVPNAVIHTTGEITQLGGTHNPAATQAEIVRLTEELQRQFFTNVFLAVMTNDKNQKTATEIDALQAEQFASIGPMISNLRAEFWSPMIHRVLDLLIEAGQIESPDEGIAGGDFEVSYISQIDTKMGLMDAQKTMQAINSIVGLLQIAAEVPAINRIVKIEKIATAQAEAMNVDYDNIVSDYEREAMDEQAAAAAQEQAAMQKQELDQKAVKPVDMAQAPEPGSPGAMQMEQAAPQI
jgi:hypothetical protein